MLMLFERPFEISSRLLDSRLIGSRQEDRNSGRKRSSDYNNIVYVPPILSKTCPSESKDSYTNIQSVDQGKEKKGKICRIDLEALVYATVWERCTS